METEAAQDFLGVSRQALQLVVGSLRGGELDQLHLVELVLANNSAHILSIGPRLAAKTRGVSRVLQGQVLGRQNLPAMNVRDRNLRRGHQVVVEALDLE